jgi:hypothetical protein
MLIDNDMAHEATDLIRSVLEYTVVMHWIIERGEPGVDAMLANQSKRVKAWLHHAEGTSLMVPSELAKELSADVSGIDESKALKQFEQICSEVDACDLYAVYGVQSLYTHPTITTSNTYTNPIGQLTLKPNGPGPDGNVMMLAYCLIWAQRAFDQLMPGKPRAEGLEKLAHSVRAKPIIPKYRPIPPKARNTRRSRARQGRGR